MNRKMVAENEKRDCRGGIDPARAVCYLRQRTMCENYKSRIDMTVQFRKVSGGMNPAPTKARPKIRLNHPGENRDGVAGKSYLFSASAPP